MKTFFYTFLLILISTSYAPTVFAQSQAFVAYAIPANDPYENSLSGAGWHFNYDAITLHTELTFDRAGLTAFGKRAIISDNLYIKYGSALARQKFFSDGESLWANQYSTGLALDYTHSGSLHLKIGSIYTRLPSKTFSNDYIFQEETTTWSYAEITKRFAIQDTFIDFFANYAVTNRDFSDNYGNLSGGVDLYRPDNNLKLSGSLYNDNGTITKKYSAHWNSIFAEYTELPDNRFHARIGLQFTWNGFKITPPQHGLAERWEEQRFENYMKSNMWVKMRGITALDES